MILFEHDIAAFAAKDSPGDEDTGQKLSCENVGLEIRIGVADLTSGPSRWD